MSNDTDIHKILSRRGKRVILSNYNYIKQYNYEIYMKYFIFLFSIVAWGALGLIIGKGVAGTWREESNADKKARILNDPDVQTCTHDSEE